MIFEVPDFWGSCSKYYLKDSISRLKSRSIEFCGGDFSKKPVNDFKFYDNVTVKHKLL